MGLLQVPTDCEACRCCRQPLTKRVGAAAGAPPRRDGADAAGLHAHAAGSAPVHDDALPVRSAPGRKHTPVWCAPQGRLSTASHLIYCPCLLAVSPAAVPSPERPRGGSYAAASSAAAAETDASKMGPFSAVLPLCTALLPAHLYEDTLSLLRIPGHLTQPAGDPCRSSLTWQWRPPTWRASTKTSRPGAT